MFNFLKKKLKKIEEKLEAELETELQKELKETVIEKPQTKPQEQKPVVVEPLKPIEAQEKPVIPVAEKKKIVPEIKKVDKPREQPKEEKKEREKQLDKQLEESIEVELQRIVSTRKSVEEALKTEKRPTIGISDEKLDELLWDLEVGLLESDVAFSVIESIKKDIKEEFKHTSIDRSHVSDFVQTVLKNAIAHVLTTSALNFDDFIEKRKKPIVIMFVGVNGSGKTLSIAKLATYLLKKGKTCVMAAGDTFRAGAIEQLEIHANNVGVKIIKHGSGADPAAVAYDAIEHAKAKHKDVVLLDTAGRMQTNFNLMEEMAKIKRVAKPDLILFVGDALSGNDAVEQAKRFNEIVGIDGVILTKVDADAKGGSALSIAYTIGKPLLFIGVGQNYEDQIPFDPAWMVKNIFSE